MKAISFHRTTPATTIAEKKRRDSFVSAQMEETIINSEPIITKWDPYGSAYSKITSIFYESREEANFFLSTVSDLQRALQFFVKDHTAADLGILTRGQRLMDTAMKRLQKEFYQILAVNRERLDSESLSRASTSSSITRVSTSNSLSDMDDGLIFEEEVDDDVGLVPTKAMRDLRAIAECMISTGYAKECVKVYKVTRRSTVDEGLYRLGYDGISSSRVQKLDWDSVDQRMKNWNSAARVAVKTLFPGERFLADCVFGFSDSLKESCFSEIIREPAEKFFSFPAVVAGKSKKSPEKVFQFLDLYDTISDMWSDIDSIFSSKSTSAVKEQAFTSLNKLADTIRSLLSNFESKIQKDSSKDVVPGGGIHPLTRYVMNYMAFLGDYSTAMSEIYSNTPLPATSPMPDTFFYNFINTTSCPASPISVHSSIAMTTVEDEEYYNNYYNVSSRLAWILLLLLCKLDEKAGFYKNTALSYLFLSNNLHYVVQKVRGSQLRHLLGREWMIKNEEKARTYAKNYVRIGWKTVVEAIPEDPRSFLIVEGVEASKARMREFNSAFDEAYRTQRGWVVADRKMRENVKVLIARNVMSPYQEFYGEFRQTAREVVRFSPEDIGNYISDLFYGNEINGSSAGSITQVENILNGRTFTDRNSRPRFLPCLHLGP